MVEQIKNFVFTNWARNQQATPKYFFKPASEEEVIELVKWAASKQLLVKVVGRGHSWTDIAISEDVMISLEKMNAILDVGSDQRSVTVQAGIWLKDLNAELARRGLAMTILGTIAEQSLAGVISTGTHGGSFIHGNISSFVTGLRMVTAQGTVVEWSEEQDAEKLRAARVSLGALGIITQVTLRCEPAFRLEQDIYSLDWDEGMNVMLKLARGNEYSRFYWIPHVNLMQVYVANRTTKPSNLKRWKRWLDQYLVQPFGFGTLFRIVKHWPQLTPKINTWGSKLYLKKQSRIGPSDMILTSPLMPIHREVEYALNLDQVSGALREVREFIEAEKIYANYVVELRYVKGDQNWMSLAYGEDRCFINCCTANNPSQAKYFTGFERIMLKHGGRPHWGKEFSLSANEIVSMYPEAPRFIALARELDPQGMFSNAYLERVLGLKSK